MESCLDVPYVLFGTERNGHRNKFQEFDIYVPRDAISGGGGQSPPLISFVHGGAWHSCVKYKSYSERHVISDIGYIYIYSPIEKTRPITASSHASWPLIPVVL